MTKLIYYLPPYQIDRIGYYWMSEDGLKFRPIVVEDGVFKILTPAIALAREKRRNGKWLNSS